MDIIDLKEGGVKKMLIVDIENIKLPTINNRYGVNSKTGQLYLSSEYRRFKRDLVNCCRKVIILPPYSIIISQKTYKDIDATIKILLDSLQQARVIKDDKFIINLHIIKIPILKGQPESLKIDVEHIDL